jgi:predicted transcriptional regulator with HTH domain
MNTNIQKFLKIKNYCELGLVIIYQRTYVKYHAIIEIKKKLKLYLFS